MGCSPHTRFGGRGAREPSVPSEKPGEIPSFQSRAVPFKCEPVRSGAPSCHALLIPSRSPVPFIPSGARPVPAGHFLTVNLLFARSHVLSTARVNGKFTSAADDYVRRVRRHQLGRSNQVLRSIADNQRPISLCRRQLLAGWVAQQGNTGF